MGVHCECALEMLQDCSGSSAWKCSERVLQESMLRECSAAMLRESVPRMYRECSGSAFRVLRECCMGDSAHALRVLWEHDGVLWEHDRVLWECSVCRDVAT